MSTVTTLVATHIRRQTYLCVMRYKLRPMCNALTKRNQNLHSTQQNLINFLATSLINTSDLPFIICSIMKVFQAVMLVAAIATASGQESVSFLPLLSLVPLACRWPICSAEFSSIHTDSTHEEIMRLLYDMDCLI